MTTSEACVFLGIEHLEDAEEAFEEAVFTIRQQLIAGPVLLKTTESRCKRLQNLEEAWLTISGKQKMEQIVQAEKNILPDAVLERLTNYHQLKSSLLQKMGSTLEVSVLKFLAYELVELERLLCEPFSRFVEWGDVTVTIGKEPDPMPVLKLVREQAELGHTTIADLYENKNKLPTELLIALKRLSLLKNYLHP